VKVLGCDPSLTNFGWAIHDDAAAIGEGRCVARGRIQTSSKELEISRYTTIRSELQRLIQEHQPDRISIEYPVFNSLYSEGMYGLFLFTWEAIRSEKKDVVFFSPGQLKAHARQVLGRPQGWKMMKADMVQATQVDTLGTRWNHNEADAYWAARTGARFWRLFDGDITTDDLTKIEKHQFLKIHTFQRGRKAGKTERKGLLFREDSRFFLHSES
jgi:Holliday junction resolvasome RuvABC endonuclease subunit